MLIDSHVNLHSEKFADDLDAVIARAREAGVRAMLTISDRLESTEAIKTIADWRAGIWRSVGVHPHHAKDFPDLDAKTLIELAEDERVVGIGECGLDFHYEYSDRDAQAQVFRAHIEAARETGLPLVIHARDADDAVRTMLEEERRKGAFVPLLHCYTGGPELARAALDMGGYISFSGIITFRNADDIRAVAKDAPLERVIIETDCPYLAPVPMRGRRNEPAFLVHVAEKLAEIRGIGFDDAAQTTTGNFFRLFARARREEIVP
ncbi:TatD family hydrolase [Amphiplicatus metriothermophilus]|uniref:Sec-independent protein translocase TatD n=1 Tax=Amphiplicatus metriothermophilus TaxID=1519374 RepID=A0A239PQM8_9PROT|nr:Sec-independent protein translocase TatD [Amphiplicatus metriothermophilus]